jgi:hypothetical protein
MNGKGIRMTWTSPYPNKEMNGMARKKTFLFLRARTRQAPVMMIKPRYNSNLFPPSSCKMKLFKIQNIYS